MSGLCARCHTHAPGEKSPLWRQEGGPLARPTIVVDACPDCHAWGVTRTYGWVCPGCKSWREHYHDMGPCRTCGQRVAVNRVGSCRLCWKTRSLLAHDLGRRTSQVSVAEANRHGQQLFFASMWHREGHGRRPYIPQTVPPDLSLLRPVEHQQLVLLDWPRDLKAGLRHGFPPPPDPARQAAWHAFVREFADEHGWGINTLETVQRGLRILQGIQDTPGAAFRASEVLPLRDIPLPVRPVLDVLAAAGMLVEDRVPTIVRWYQTQTQGLPDQMRHELDVWFDTARHGSRTPPRFRPRDDRTVRAQLNWALPTLRIWARTHDSLREIGRDDVLAALPASGSARTSVLQGLRSIFRVLKARKLTFVNPTSRIHLPRPENTAPAPIDLHRLRQALDSDDPTRAALAALLAFHAVYVRQLRALQLTDVHDGRLFLDDRIVPLADPVRLRLSAYLDYRQQHWPNTANPHLFIHYRNANTTNPVTPWWISKRLGMSAESVRMDRILDEAHASGGDVRLLCDLFGLSVAGAYRYTATVDHPGISSG